MLEGFGEYVIIATKQIAVSTKDSPDCIVRAVPPKIARAGDDGLAVRADGYAKHRVRVPLQRALDLTRRQVPHAMSCGKVLE